MFNINEFKSKVNEHGGPALNSLFVAEIARISEPGGILTNDLRFFCQSVSVPGINIEVMQYKPAGIGFPEFMPMSTSPDQLNCVFMLDSDHKIITFFHKWMNSIINVGGDRGIIPLREPFSSRGSGIEPKEINYKNEYTTSMVVKHYSAFGNSNEIPGFYEYRFEGVFPTQIGPLQLSWSDTSLSTSTVNFSYSRILHQGFQRASPQNSQFILGSQESIRRGGTINQVAITQSAAQII